MIYLIKVEYKNETLLKIGYADNVDKRMIAYKTHNPNYELLDTREGNEQLEKHLHKYFSKYSYSQVEWFYYNQEIIDNFQKITLDTAIPFDYDKELNKITKTNDDTSRLKINNNILKVYSIFYTNSVTINNKIISFLRQLDEKLFYLESETEQEWIKIYNEIYNLVEDYKNKYNSFINKNIDHLKEFNLLTNTLSIKEISLIGKNEFIEKLYNIKILSKNKILDLIKIINEMNLKLLKINTTKDKMKLVYDYIFQFQEYKKEILNNLWKVGYIDIYNYFINVPLEKIKSTGFNTWKINNEIDLINKSLDIKSIIVSKFNSGKRYTKKYIKETIQLIYDSLNLNKIAKATDLKRYFEVKRVRITAVNKSREEGFEILKIKN